MANIDFTNGEIIVQYRYSLYTISKKMDLKRFE